MTAQGGFSAIDPRWKAALMTWSARTYSQAEGDLDEKILTKHPDPNKQGVRISKAKYDVVRQTILDLVRAQGEMTFTQLTNAANERLAGKFDGSVSWYVATVKLDLEARNEIQRVPGTSPQRLRLVAD